MCCVDRLKPQPKPVIPNLSQLATDEHPGGANRGKIPRRDQHKNLGLRVPRPTVPCGSRFPTYQLVCRSDAPKRRLQSQATVLRYGKSNLPHLRGPIPTVIEITAVRLPPHRNPEKGTQITQYSASLKHSRKFPFINYLLRGIHLTGGCSSLRRPLAGADPHRHRDHRGNCLRLPPHRNPEKGTQASQSLHSILQVLSVTAFEKVPIYQLLTY